MQEPKTRRREKEEGEKKCNEAKTRKCGTLELLEMYLRRRGTGAMRLGGSLPGFPWPQRGGPKRCNEVQGEAGEGRFKKHTGQVGQIATVKGLEWTPGPHRACPSRAWLRPGGFPAQKQQSTEIKVSPKPWDLHSPLRPPKLTPLRPQGARREEVKSHSV